ncbi:KinB-signaling pathway activation protein [Brevibacillus fluminis]|uniref:KinB-signaling pathway activation protein n=1 Tax=Brevibacillus fluminis TaxID=511487 RepID=UPI003F8AA991
MSVRKFGWMFWTTLLLGGIGGLLSGVLLGREELFGGSLSNFFMGSFMSLLIGLTVSIVAQMGLFAYMTFNYMALSIFKSASLWKNVQIFLILFTFFDMVYLRIDGARGSVLLYMIEPLLLLLIALVTAYAKVKLTNPKAWVPTVFFIFVVTAIEWIPGLTKDDNFGSMLMMIMPLLFCNVWQVLQLHRITAKKES